MALRDVQLAATVVTGAAAALWLLTLAHGHPLLWLGAVVGSIAGGALSLTAAVMSLRRDHR